MNEKQMAASVAGYQIVLDHFGRGGKAKIAECIGRTQAAVGLWKYIPAEHCLNIQALTNGEVTVYQMRPDVFGNGPVSDSPEKRVS